MTFEPNKEIFRTRLNELVHASNANAKDIAKSCGFGAVALSHYRTGYRYPSSISIIWSLADYFGVSIDYLVGRSDVKSLPGDVRIQNVSHLLSIASDEDIAIIRSILAKYGR